MIVHFFVGHIHEEVIQESTSEVHVSRDQKYCVGDDHKNCVPPFKRFDNKYRTAEKYNLGACVIEKSMSTVLAAIMCFLHDEKAFKSANRTLTTDMWENRWIYIYSIYNELLRYDQRSPLDSVKKRTSLARSKVF